MSEPETMRRIAFFGGSFNPPHVGHVLAAVYALTTAPLDEVLVVPVYRHPFAKELAPYADRLAMCRLAFGWIPRVTISSVEEELGGDSLTLRTLEHLAAEHPDWRLRLLIGADVIADLPKWHRADRIAELAPPLVLGRSATVPHATVDPRFQPGDALLPAVSSTSIREAVRAGNLAAVEPRLPRAIAAYIRERGLYT